MAQQHFHASAGQLQSDQYAGMISSQGHSQSETGGPWFIHRDLDERLRTELVSEVGFGALVSEQLEFTGLSERSDKADELPLLLMSEYPSCTNSPLDAGSRRSLHHEANRYDRLSGNAVLYSSSQPICTLDCIVPNFTIGPTSHQPESNNDFNVLETSKKSYMKNEEKSKEVRGATSRALIEQIDGLQNVLQTTITAFQATGRSPSRYPPQSTCSYNKMGSKDCGTDAPNAMKKLMDEFNDLTKKMSSLKQTLKDLGSSVTSIRPKASKSCSADKQTVITDVCGAKQVILDCIAELSVIKDYLDGNESNVANDQKLLRDDVTEGCCKEKDPHIHGRLGGKEIILMFETGDQCSRERKENSNPAFHVRLSVGKASIGKVSSTTVAMTTGTSGGLETMEQNVQSSVTDGIHSNQPDPVPNGPRDSLKKDEGSGTSSAFKKDSGTSAVEVRQLNVTSRKGGEMAYAINNKLEPLKETEVPKFNAAVDLKLPGYSYIHTSEARIPSQEPSIIEENLRTSSEIEPNKKKKWYTFFTQCIDKTFSEVNSQIETNPQSLIRQTKNLSSDNDETHQKIVDARKGGIEKRSTTQNKETKRVIRKDEDHDRTNVTLFSSMRNFLITGETSTPSIRERNNEPTTSETPQNTKLPKNQSRVFYARPKPPNNIDPRYEFIQNYYDGRADTRDYKRSRLFHAYRAMEHSGAQNFLKLYFGLTSQSDLTSAPHHPSNDKSFTIFPYHRKSDDSLCSPRRTKSVSLLYADEHCREIVVYSAEELANAKGYWSRGRHRLRCKICKRTTSSKLNRSSKLKMNPSPQSSNEECHGCIQNFENQCIHNPLPKSAYKAQVKRSRLALSTGNHQCKARTFQNVILDRTRIRLKSQKRQHLTRNFCKSLKRSKPVDNITQTEQYGISQNPIENLAPSTGLSDVPASIPIVHQVEHYCNLHAPRNIIALALKKPQRFISEAQGSKPQFPKSYQSTPSKPQDYDEYSWGSGTSFQTNKSRKMFQPHSHCENKDNSMKRKLLGDSAYISQRQVFMRESLKYKRQYICSRSRNDQARHHGPRSAMTIQHTLESSGDRCKDGQSGSEDDLHGKIDQSNMVWALAIVNVFNDGSQSYEILQTTPLPAGKKVNIKGANAIRVGETHHRHTSR